MVLTVIRKPTASRDTLTKLGRGAMSILMIGRGQKVAVHLSRRGRILTRIAGQLGRHNQVIHHLQGDQMCSPISRAGSALLRYTALKIRRTYALGHAVARQIRAIDRDKS